MADETTLALLTGPVEIVSGALGHWISYTVAEENGGNFMVWYTNTRSSDKKSYRVHGVICFSDLK